MIEIDHLANFVLFHFSLRVEAEEVHQFVECQEYNESEACDEDDSSKTACEGMGEWEDVVQSEDFRFWRKFDPETQLYTYKGNFFPFNICIVGFECWCFAFLKINIHIVIFFL